MVQMVILCKSCLSTSVQMGSGIDRKVIPNYYVLILHLPGEGC